MFSDGKDFRLSAIVAKMWLPRVCVILMVIFGMLPPSADGAAVDSTALNQARIRDNGLIAELEAELASSVSASDSVIPLFNIFDLSVGKEKTRRGFELFGTARRARRDDVALEVLLNIANFNIRNDSILDATLSLAGGMPESKDRSHTITFITILRNATAARSATAEVRNAKFQELLRQASSSAPEDIYERIARLHVICVYLSEMSEGELLADYLHRLGNLIDQAPDDNHALRNSFYVWASLIYTKVGQSELAVQACRSLLHEIDALEERNRRMGRVYRSYDDNRYIIYTRLLENYEALAPSEADKYYSEAMRIAGSNQRAAATYALAPLPSIYYAFYQKRYRKAFELIRDCKDSPYLERNRLKIMGMYIGAATAIGEKEALLEAYPGYVRMLEEYLETRQRERYRELQVLYDVNEIKTENLRLREEQEHSRKQLWRGVTMVCVALLAALAVFVCFLLRFNRRTAMLANRLKVANRNLKKESTSLREARDELEKARDKAYKADALKTDFINNMSHEVKVPLQAMQEYCQMIVENVDDGSKKYLSTFADRLMLNCELVNTLIHDVLQLAEIHNSSLQIKNMPQEVRPICEASADAVRRRLKPGVKMSVVTDGPDFIMVTDRYRLTQILTNLLSNAAKFTAEGSVTLEYAKSGDGQSVRFTVTDTGIGIAPENHEFVFGRFAKVDSSVPGAGIGLTISRMLARLMGGSLIIDPSYTLGARFILTLPLQ